MDFKNEIAKAISNEVNELNIEDIIDKIEIPADSQKGDYAFPCFNLAKVMKKSPVIIAEELVDKIVKPECILQINNESGFLNFFIDKKIFAEDVITNITKIDNYGSSKEGEGKNVTFDFASLNIAKPFHIGHLKNAVTGDSLYRIYKYLGYNSIGINHLGDWGTQFGKLIVAFKKWGNKEEVEKKGIMELVKLYIKFHDEAEKDKSLEDEGRAWFTKIENGDKEAVEIWDWFKDISLEYFNIIANELDINMDYLTGESFYSDKIPAVVKELEEKGLLIDSNGAKVVDLEDYNMPPCLVLKSDGSTLYATRDLATVFYRKNTFNFYKSIYITGAEQNLHFKQFFKVIKKMGYEWADDMIHIGHGMVKLEDGNLSTRKGRIVTLEDVMKEATDKTLEIIKEKSPDLENKEEVAKQVGIGAIKFNNLYNNSNKDVIFSWDKTLSFDGETGPYVQYTYARACSLLRKGGEVDYTKVDYSVLADDTTYDLLKSLFSFPEKVKKAAYKYEPSYISRAVIEIAQKFNKFYNEYSIVVDDETIKNSRLAVTEVTKKVIKTGLSLIGLEAPEKM